MGNKKEEIAEVVEMTEEVIEETVEETVEEVIEEVIERPYELRELKNRDLYPVLKILTKTIPDNLKDAFMQVITHEKTLDEIGGMVACDMIVMVVKNIHKAQQEVDSFCADMIGKTVEELNDMEFGTTGLILYDVFGDVKNTSFFKVLSKLF